MDTGSSAGTPPSGESALDVISAERSRLINVAYRLLGSLADSEDAVQEASARWYALPVSQREAIDSPAAWLTTVTSRICLDQLRSARARRERYVGEWLPEPVPDRTEWLSGADVQEGTDPADRITLDESVDMAFMVVLDSMTPAERVAFLLHDVFRYTFTEVAEIVGRSPAACRQLASSGRRRVHEGRPPVTTSARRADVVAEFKRAWEAKDIRRLVNVLDPEVVVTPDSGGLVPAALEPVSGADRIAHYVLDLIERVPDVTLLERTVNGQPGLVAMIGGRIETVFAFEVDDARITHVWAMRNPEKLRPWATC